MLSAKCMSTIKKIYIYLEKAKAAVTLINKRTMLIIYNRIVSRVRSQSENGIRDILEDIYQNSIETQDMFSIS